MAAYEIGGDRKSTRYPRPHDCHFVKGALMDACAVNVQFITLQLNLLFLRLARFVHPTIDNFWLSTEPTSFDMRSTVEGTLLPLRRVSLLPPSLFSSAFD